MISTQRLLVGLTELNRFYDKVIKNDITLWVLAPNKRVLGLNLLGLFDSYILHHTKLSTFAI
jgi:hypothetical protein